MREILQHIIIVLLLPIMLFAPSGVNVYKHSCSSADLYEVSLFEITTCAEKSQLPACCSAAEAKTCAVKASVFAHEQAGALGFSCCNYDTERLEAAGEWLFGPEAQELSVPSTWSTLLFASHLLKTGSSSFLPAFSSSSGIAPPSLSNTHGIGMRVRDLSLLI